MTIPKAAKSRLLAVVMLASLVAGLIASLVAGCAFRAAQPALIYRLNILPAPPAAAASSTSPSAPAIPAGSGIELLPLRSNRPQSGSLAILVAEIGTVVRVEEFAAGRWEEAPETAIDRALATRLKAYTQVAPAQGAPADDQPSTPLARPRLRATLERFELVETAPGGRAHVAVTLGYDIISPADRRLLASGEIHERQPLPTAAALDPAPDAALDVVVQAFDQATTRALERLTTTVIAFQAKTAR
jgi:hypothetical protein